MKHLMMTTALIVAGSTLAFAQETTDPNTVAPVEEGTTQMPADDAATDTMTDDGMDDDAMTDEIVVEDADVDIDVDVDATTPSEGSDVTTLEADMVNPMANMPGWMEPDGFVRYEGEALTSEILKDANVYDVMNNSVSSISDFVLDDQGAITHVIIDVGGFLGIGQRSVAIPFEDLVIYQEVNIMMTDDGIINDDADLNDDDTVVADGTVDSTVTDPNMVEGEGLVAGDLRIYLPMTEEQLEALPEVDI